MAVINIDIVVDSLEEVLEFFDRIEVHRSTTVEGGPYTEITDLAGPTSAVVDGSLAGPFNLDGTSLEITIDNASEPKVVEFSGDDPFSLQDIIDQINEVVEDLASEVPSDTNRLRLTSPTAGTGSSLLISGGTAATQIGLSTTKVVGKERRIRIVEPTTMYELFDKDGRNEYWYKTRFSSSTTSLVSEFSIPRQGGAVSVVPQEQLVKATLTMLNGEGNPIVGRRIIFIPVSKGVVATTSFFILPGADSRIEVLTNGSGYAEANLIRGITYRVAIEGAAFMREFVAPPIVDSFDLFSIIGTAPDPYDIVQAPPRPIKVST